MKIARTKYCSSNFYGVFQTSFASDRTLHDVTTIDAAVTRAKLLTVSVEKTALSTVALTDAARCPEVRALQDSVKQWTDYDYCCRPASCICSSQMQGCQPAIIKNLEIYKMVRILRTHALYPRCFHLYSCIIKVPLQSPYNTIMHNIIIL